MEQPFHIYGSPDGGPPLVRRPIVLARIPYVGAHIDAVAESSPVGHTAPAPAVESQLGEFSQGTRFYVDSQHTSMPPVEDEPHWQTELHGQPEPQSRSPDNHRHHRTHGHHRSSESFSTDSPQLGVATGLSRWLGELASYAGLIVTLVLVVSGGLLYWMVIAPSQPPVVDSGNSYETFGSAGIGIPKFTPRTAPPDERQFAAPNVSVDPLYASWARQSGDAESAAAADEQVFVQKDAYRAAENQSSREVSSLPGTTGESASELIRLPEQTPTSSDGPAPIFNDASALAYPVTDHLHGWDPARLRVTDVAGKNAATSSTKPEVAQRAALPVPLPVNR